MVDIPIQMVNGTNGVVIQTDDPNISLITLIATIILAIAAMAGVAISVWQTLRSNQITKESNELLRTELTARLRPLVSLGGFTSFIIEKNAKKYLQIKTSISNSGTIEMRSLRIFTGLIEGLFIEQVVKSENDLNTRHEILTTF